MVTGCSHASWLFFLTKLHLTVVREAAARHATYWPLRKTLISNIWCHFWLLPSPRPHPTPHTPELSPIYPLHTSPSYTPHPRPLTHIPYNSPQSHQPQPIPKHNPHPLIHTHTPLTPLSSPPCPSFPHSLLNPSQQHSLSSCPLPSSPLPIPFILLLLRIPVIHFSPSLYPHPMTAAQPIIPSHPQKYTRL